jgi:alkylation response protein AidB-like acyl-CoA dehydrogenase
VSAQPATHDAAAASASGAVHDRVRRLLAAHPPDTTPAREFLAAQFDAGLAWVHFPAGHGGLGIDRATQLGVDELLRDAGAPAPPLECIIGLGMAAEVLVAHGTAGQRTRHLRPIFTGEEIWCQLFSEPGAGSDIAGLATRAEQAVGGWRVTGQKVWTSLAHLARFGLLAARSDPTVPKHRGLTFFILDMAAPGVDIRPIRQITGDGEFNEVYLDAVRIDDSQRLGDVGGGWDVILTTLMSERVALGAGLAGSAGESIGRLLDLWRSDRAVRDPVLRDRVAAAWILATAHGRLVERAAEDVRAGRAGPAGSLGKLSGTRLSQELTELTLDILGAAGALYGSYAMQRHRAAHDDRTPGRAFLRARANTIEGGTSEVMRSIVGERVLGLPGEPRSDRDVPWQDLPRG